ncbi:hypothetical protein [Moraxella lacunata]
MLLYLVTLYKCFYFGDTHGQILFYQAIITGSDDCHVLANHSCQGL